MKNRPRRRVSDILLLGNPREKHLCTPGAHELSGTETHPQRIAAVNANPSDGGTEPTRLSPQPITAADNGRDASSVSSRRSARQVECRQSHRQRSDQAPIGPDVLPGDPAIVVACQQGHHVGDVLGQVKAVGS